MLHCVAPVCRVFRDVVHDIIMWRFARGDVVEHFHGAPEFSEEFLLRFGRPKALKLYFYRPRYGHRITRASGLTRLINKNNVKLENLDVVAWKATILPMLPNVRKLRLSYAIPEGTHPPIDAVRMCLKSNAEKLTRLSLSNAVCIREVDKGIMLTLDRCVNLTHLQIRIESHFNFEPLEYHCQGVLLLKERFKIERQQ